MPKRLLDVGQCGPDHANITRFVRAQFGDVDIVQTDRLDDTLEALRRDPFDLVLVNRKLDIDYSDGLDIIHAIKADPALAEVPVMLVTNYPEHQEQAVAAGAEYGFGKLEFNQPTTAEKLRPFLG